MTNILGRVLGALGIQQTEEYHIGFKAIGDGYWSGIFTNKFVDKQEDILTSKAHGRYVKRVQSGLVPLPPVVIYHAHEPDEAGNTKATTKFAETLWIDHVDGFTFAFGKFDNTPIGKAVEEFYRATKAVDTMSHRFVAPRWARSYETVKAVDGQQRTVRLYDDYNVIELTVVPPGAEVNPYTGFVLNEGQQEKKTMPLSEEQKAAINRVLEKKPDLAQEIIAQFDRLDEKAKALEDAGVVYKAFSDFSDVTVKAEEAQEKADNGTSLDGTLLVTLLETQNDLLERQIAMEKAVAKTLEELKTSKQESDALVKALRLRIDEKPQTVDDSTANVVTGEKAEEIEDVIEQQEKAVEFDNFWGSAKVPRK